MRRCFKLLMFLILIFITLTSLFGCEDSKNLLVDTEPVVRVPEEMISLSIGYTDMVRISAYNYKLREKDGEVFFSCYFFTEDDYEEIDINDLPINSKYMLEMRDLVKKYGFTNMEPREDEHFDGEILFVADAPMYSLTMSFPKTIGERISSESHRLNFHPTGSDEVLKLFIEIREKYITKSNIQN